MPRVDEMEQRRDGVRTAPPIDAAHFYERVASGEEFSVYQDLGVGRYDECYFNPDCVLLFPATKQVYWFDLDHLSVGLDSQGIRRYVPGHLWRKKFAFSYDGNRLSVLPYTILHAQAGQPSEMRAQRVVDVKYLPGERYRELCECPADGSLSPQGRADLDAAWRSHQKLKVGVTLGHSLLIYPVRLAFHNRGVYSFSSKTVVIPKADVHDFSWDQAVLGTICVTSDGSCSLYRQDNPLHPVKHLMATCFSGPLNVAARVFDPSPRPFRERLRALARPIVRRLAPFQVEQSRRSFVICVREDGTG